MVAKYSGKLRVERDGVTSALLVLNNTTGEGILVNSEGSAYARYSAYLPFAKPYLDYEIARIADYCVSEGAENTSDGLWAITFDEVCEHFNIDLSDDPEIRDDLLDILRTREEIAEIVATEDEFEIKYSMISVLRFRYSKNNTRMHLRKMLMWHWQSTFCGFTMSPAECAQTFPVSGFGMWTSADTNSIVRFSEMRCLKTVSLIPQNYASPTFPERYSRTAKCNIFQPTN